MDFFSWEKVKISQKIESRCWFNENLINVLGVMANVQSKSNIPISANIEINPKGFTVGVKVNKGKIVQFAPSY